MKNLHRHTMLSGPPALPIAKPGTLLYWTGNYGRDEGLARVMRVHNSYYTLRSLTAISEYNQELDDGFGDFETVGYTAEEWTFPTAGLTDVAKSRDIMDSSQLFLAGFYLWKLAEKSIAAGFYKKPPQDFCNEWLNRNTAAEGMIGGVR